MGLELEETQYVILLSTIDILLTLYRRRLTQDVAVLKSSSTTLQQANIQERRLQLEKRILAFRAIQVAYMPEAARLLNENSNENPTAEADTLLLPSELPAPMRISNPRMCDMESKLRYAQASDAIVELRQSLAVRAHLTKYKHDQVRGQRPNTRVRALLDKAEARTNGIASRYRDARSRYQVLVGPGEWEAHLKPLRSQDIRTMSAAEDESERGPRDGPGEGHRTLSWIWMVTGAAESDSPDMHEGE